MKIMTSCFFFEDDVNGIEIIKKIERAGRTAYKSEDKITEDSARDFIQKIIKSGHLSVVEHHSITVRIICDRGVSHEIVRHRIASYTQESTRYCNYNNGKFGNEITVIKPSFWDNDVSEEKMKIWNDAMLYAEEAYKKLIDLGASPQQARSVLPNSLKTEIVVTMNLREWRHFFSLRTPGNAHPQMYEIARPLLDEFKKKIPYIFDDISY